MLSVVIYYVVLAITVAIAIWRGGPTERRAAYIALFASVLTTAVMPFPTWTNMESAIFVIDLGVLLSFWQIAMRSGKFWPYWITGWQLISILGHLQKLLFIEILPRPYSLLSIYISYPILLVIVIASIRAGRANRKALNPA
jgi:hypothetical protein